MVRVKYRYVVVKVELEDETRSTTGRFAALTDKSLHKCIISLVTKYYGEFGIASIRYGLKCKYCNDQTRIAIIRVRHGPHRFLTSVLPLANVIGEHIIKLRTLYNGATIMQCNKFIVGFQQKYLKRVMPQIKSAGEQKQLEKNILNYAIYSK